MTVQILVGDVRDRLRDLPDASVHVVVTSPPYFNLRDYGTAEWRGGDAACDHVVGEIRTGLGMAALGAKYRGGGKKASIPKPMPAKHLCPRCGAVRVDQQIGSEATPAEYIATMVEVFREVRRVLRADGTLWLNLGDSYGGLRGVQVSQTKHRTHKFGNANRAKTLPDGIKSKDLMMIPARVAIALQADGWFLRQALPWVKRNAMPESAKDRPTTAVEYVFMLTKSPRYFYDYEAVKRKARNGTVPDAALAVMPDSRAFRNSDLFFDSLPGAFGAIVDDDGEIIALDVTSQGYSEAHFATFPPKLVEPLIIASSRPGDVVLDPFGGAGTTGLVADRLGREVILVELNASYAVMARERIGLFADLAVREAAQ